MTKKKRKTGLDPIVVDLMTKASDDVAAAVLRTISLAEDRRDHLEIALGAVAGCVGVVAAVVRATRPEYAKMKDEALASKLLAEAHPHLVDCIRYSREADRPIGDPSRWGRA